MEWVLNWYFCQGVIRRIDIWYIVMAFRIACEKRFSLLGPFVSNEEIKCSNFI